MLYNSLFRGRIFVNNSLRFCGIKINSFKINFNYHNTSQNRLYSKVLDQNTNVVKDLMLFKYENPRFFKLLNIFGICQFCFWTYLSTFAFTTLRDAPVEINKEMTWWRKINLGENKYRNTITVLCFFIGEPIYVFNYSLQLLMWQGL